MAQSLAGGNFRFARAGLVCACLLSVVGSLSLPQPVHAQDQTQAQAPAPAEAQTQAPAEVQTPAPAPAETPAPAQPQPQPQDLACKKPSGAIERTICADPSLLQLDASLASVLKSALAAAPDQSIALLADQRRWRSSLARQCKKKRGDAADALYTCLAGAYRSRIAELNGVAKDAASRSAVGSCQLIADRYRDIADLHPLDTPLGAVANPDSGITLAAPLGAVNGLPSALAGWAAAQQPAFTIADELSQAVDFSSGTIEKLPNANFYSISTVGGEAQCIESVYFTVKDGQAQRAAPPPGFEDDAASCGAHRTYGTIDNTPALFEESYATGPSMESSIKVATWGTDQFTAACKVRFSYVPRFTYRLLKDWDNSCNGGYECEPMRVESYRLAKDVQRDPAGTQKKLLAGLSTEQQVEYYGAIQDAHGDQGAATVPDGLDPSTLTEESPLRLPYYNWGRLYVASLYHFTSGSQYYSDWRVKFEKIEDGRLLQVAVLSVGMTKGEVADVSITSLMPGN